MLTAHGARRWLRSRPTQTTTLTVNLNSNTLNLAWRLWACGTHRAAMPTGTMWATFLDTTEEEDSVLYELLEHFNVYDWFETDEDEEENLEIDLDGGLSAINE